MRRLKIALEGGINGLSDDDCRSWRDRVICELEGRFDFHNPMDLDCRGKEREMVDELKSFDLQGIESSDILLVNGVNAGAGTGYAVRYGQELGKYILVIGETKSPWIFGNCDREMLRLTDAIDFLRYFTEQDIV